MRIVKDDLLDGVRDEVGEWVRAFVRRSSQPSWSARFAPLPPDHAPRSAVKAKRGRPSGLPRERILRATAATVREHGYRAVTVTDIAVAAGVARRSFYNEFPGKAEAFGAAYEDTVQRTLAVCAPAFFTPGTWPQRVWLGVQAATTLLAREPLFAYLGFVEAHAVGPPFTRERTTRSSRSRCSWRRATVSARRRSCSLARARRCARPRSSRPGSRRAATARACTSAACNRLPSTSPSPVHRPGRRRRIRRRQALPQASPPEK